VAAKSGKYPSLKSDLLPLLIRKQFHPPASSDAANKVRKVCEREGEGGGYIWCLKKTILIYLF
jgi:hypothetical protein